jgi:hypothetical protein
MDGPNQAAYKEMLTTVKYVLDIKDLCLKMNPIHVGEAWDLSPIMIVIGQGILKLE